MAEVPAFPVEPPSVTLVNAGDSPRLLELATPDPGAAEQPWETTVSLTSGIDQSAQPAGSVDPAAPASPGGSTTTLPLSVAAAPAPPPGEGESEADRRVDITVSAGGGAATAEGFKMAWRGSSAGGVDTLKLLAPPESSPADRSAVESSLLSLTAFTPVFPSEPVGVGGSWTSSLRLTGAEAGLRRTTTYTVTSIDGDTVTLDVSVDQEPTQDQLTIDNEVAGSLNGQTLSVDSATTSSEGTITVDLRRPIPVAGSVTATTRVVYTGPQPDTRVVQDMTTGVEYGG